MADPRFQQARRRRLGALALVVATGIALLLVGIRVSRDAGGGFTTGADFGPATDSAPPMTPAAAPTTAPPPTPSAPAVAGMAPPDGRNLVCLDPGHGGSDLGNVRVEDGQIVLREKDLTLNTALALADRLRADGIESVLTRTTDTEANPDNLDVNGDGTVAPTDGEAHSNEGDDLQARINTCNNAGADLLLSIHFNSSPNTDLQGYEVWYNDERPFSDREPNAFATLVHDDLGARMGDARLRGVRQGDRNRQSLRARPRATRGSAIRAGCRARWPRACFSRTTPTRLSW